MTSAASIEAGGCGKSRTASPPAGGFAPTPGLTDIRCHADVANAAVKTTWNCCTAVRPSSGFQDRGRSGRSAFLRRVGAIQCSHSTSVPKRLMGIYVTAEDPVRDAQLGV